MNYKILVDNINKVPHDYKNNLKLATINNIYEEEILLEKKTKTKYIQLRENLLNQGINIGIAKAYEEDDTSEYATGLLIKISVKVEDKYICNDIIPQDIIDKIRDCISEFGFILRDYLTIRYVGYKTANIIKKEKLTLEEYNKKYNINGILVVNKPKGITSRDVVNFVGKILDTKKVGHTGTLDPLASGVLVLTIGTATKIASLITANNKDYIATVQVGFKTDTLDIEGNIIEEKSQTIPSNIEDIIKSFEKTYMQEVPIYSAVKVNGKKLYQYARENKEVELPKKEVTIQSINLLEKDDKSFKFSCSVTKGTYIRSLIRDISLSSKTLMTMSDLIRTKQGKFTLDMAYSFDDIEKFKFKIISISDALDIPIIDIDDKTVFKVKNGSKIPNIYNIEDKVLFKYKNQEIAIYEKEYDVLKIFKML